MRVLYADNEFFRAGDDFLKLTKTGANTKLKGGTK